MNLTTVAVVLFALAQWPREWAERLWPVLRRRGSSLSAFERNRVAQVLEPPQGSEKNTGIEALTYEESVTAREATGRGVLSLPSRSSSTRPTTEGGDT